MDWLSPYWLLIINLVMAAMWLAIWLASPSSRQKHWLAVATVLAVPIAALALWRWSWDLRQISFAGNLAKIEAGIAICLVLAVCATISRRLARIPFSAKVDIHWLPYGISLALTVLATILAEKIDAPRELVVAAFICIGLVGWQLRIRKTDRIKWSVISGLIGIAIAAVAGLGASALTGIEWGAHVGPIALGFNWHHLVLMAALAATWPAIVSWSSEDPP